MKTTPAQAEFFVRTIKARRVYQVCTRSMVDWTKDAVIAEVPFPNDLAAAQLCDQLRNLVRGTVLKYVEEV